MPFPKRRATRVPQALTGTAANTRYSVQNQGLDELYVTTAAARPDPAALEHSATEGFVKVPPFSAEHDGTGYFTPGAGESIWVWRRDNGQDIDVVWAEA